MALTNSLKILISIFPKLYILVKQWSSGIGILSGSGTSHGNLPFTLFMMPATTGFSADADGTNKYINICKEKRLLPVGCGSSLHFNCDNQRINNEPCVPMPVSWNCNMMSKMKDNTGWGNDIVAFLSSKIDSELLYTGALSLPTASDKLRPVCGILEGEIMVFVFCRFRQNNMFWYI